MLIKNKESVMSQNNIVKIEKTICLKEWLILIKPVLLSLGGEEGFKGHSSEVIWLVSNTLTLQICSSNWMKIG